MPLKNLVLFILVFCPKLVNAQPLEPTLGVHQVYLSGNLIDLESTKDFYLALTKEFDQLEDPFSLIIAGDILNYDSNPNAQERQLNHIIELINLISYYPKANLICLPGDRDWSDSNSSGYQNVIKLERDLIFHAYENDISNFYWLVNKACPGPYELNIDEHLTIIGLNSQWWNHPHFKPSASDATCDYTTFQDIKEELDDLIDENRDRNVLLVAHHPIKSLGNYGGRFSLVDHFKPFPIFGSFQKAYRTNIGSNKDLINEKFDPYKVLMENAIFTHHNLIFASAHEKNHQLMKLEDNYYINSGGLNKTSYTATDFTTEFSSKKPGLMKISYYKSGSVENSFLELQSDNLVEMHKQNLMVSSCNIKNLKNPSLINLSHIPCKLEYPNLSNKVTPNPTQKIHVAAGEKYKKSWFTNLWMGKRYRDDWAAKIETEYLNIDSSYNGLIPKERGGGRQTLSLKFKSEAGDIYTFRSVDKDPSKALDYKYRETILSIIFKDQTSAQQPYGALVAADLINHIDLLHANPRLYIMPDVKALGPFRNQYGNMMGLLEEHPGKKNNADEYFAGAVDIVKSNKLFRNMFRDKSHQINSSELLRARLFDILIGDWSKHEDNWKWAAFESDDETIYRPIPRDRDMVFSRWDGILPSLADMPFGLPNTEGFDHKIKGFQSLVYQARYMDRFLLTEESKENYIKEAKFIQEQITDKDIEDAVAQLPEESYNLSGSDIISKLKQRKTDLIQYAEKYYDWLNEEVEIVGSNQTDLFEIKQNDNGAVTISVALDHEHDGEAHKYYERTFHEDETKRIRIYGLRGDDRFTILNPSHHDIDIKLFGGHGNDAYNSFEYNKKLEVYDLDDIDKQSSHFEYIDHWEKELYDYNRNRLKFDSWLPLVFIGYSSYQGSILNLGTSWTKHRWDKLDFASKHKLNFNVSSKGDYGLSYNAIWRHAIQQWDIQSDIAIANPEYFNAFYGLGNETTIDKTLESMNFYVANYNQFSWKLSLVKQFWRKSKFFIGTGYGLYHSKAIENTILDTGNEVIRGSQGSIYAIPSSMGLDLDLRDHSSFPYRGIRVKLQAENYYGLKQTAGNYGNLTSSLEYYVSNHASNKFTLGLKFAATQGYGEIPYYHQSQIGGNSGLRAYPANRFIGKSSVYLNSEIRLELLNKKDTAIPLQFGVLAFYDLAQVFSKADDHLEPTGFKSGYGGGIFIVPFTRSFSMSLVFGFSEERSFYPAFSFGSFLK